MSELNLNARTLLLKEKLDNELTIKDGTAAAFLVPKNFYVDQLPESITPAIIKEKAAYDKDFVAATTLAAGEKATTLMVADKELDGASVEGSMGEDTLKANFSRHKSGALSLGEAGATWNSYCHPTVSIKTKSSAKSSQLGRVFAHLKTEGAAKLAK